MKYQVTEIVEKVGTGAKSSITGIKNLILRSTSERLKPTRIVYLLPPTVIHKMGIKLLRNKPINFACFAMNTFFY